MTIIALPIMSIYVLMSQIFIIHKYLSFILVSTHITHFCKSLICGLFALHVTEFIYYDLKKYHNAD